MQTFSKKPDVKHYPAKDKETVGKDLGWLTKSFNSRSKINSNMGIMVGEKNNRI